MHNHFRTLSCIYNKLRTTDIEPIIFISEKLKDRTNLRGADIGCGAGRYALLLLQHLPNLHLICGDVNEAMIRQTACYLEQRGQKRFSALLIDASDLKLNRGTMDFVSTFNAIHHFEPIRFLNQAGEALKTGGDVFIYTRLKSQNRRNIWGRFFPDFYEKEDRLYNLSQIEKWIDKVEPLTLKAIHFFKSKRVVSLEELLSKAKYKHYSTFSLYSEAEFKRALKSFKQKIMRNFTNIERVQWTDENVMIHFVKG